MLEAAVALAMKLEAQRVLGVLVVAALVAVRTHLLLLVVQQIQAVGVGVLLGVVAPGIL